MTPTSKKLLASAAFAAIVGGGAGIAAAAPDPGPTADDDEAPLTSPALELATEAALTAASQTYEVPKEHLQVTSTEGADEEAVYEVDVTLPAPDGRVLEFDIDASSFAVLGTPEVGDVDQPGAPDDGDDPGDD